MVDVEVEHYENGMTCYNKNRCREPHAAEAWRTYTRQYARRRKLNGGKNLVKGTGRSPLYRYKLGERDAEAVSAYSRYMKRWYADAHGIEPPEDYMVGKMVCYGCNVPIVDLPVSHHHEADAKFSMHGRTPLEHLGALVTTAEFVPSRAPWANMRGWGRP